MSGGRMRKSYALRSHWAKDGKARHLTLLSAKRRRAIQHEIAGHCGRFPAVSDPGAPGKLGARAMNSGNESWGGVHCTCGPTGPAAASRSGGRHSRRSCTTKPAARRVPANRHSCDGRHIRLSALPLTSTQVGQRRMGHGCGLDLDLCGAVRPGRSGCRTRPYSGLNVCSTRRLQPARP